MKSFNAGDLVRCGDGKLAEVLEVSEDGKSCKVHIREGKRQPDIFVKEYKLKKAGV